MIGSYGSADDAIRSLACQVITLELLYALAEMEVLTMVVSHSELR